MVEEGGLSYGPPIPNPQGPNPVPHALIPPIAQHLDLITCVDDYGIFHGLHVDPLTVFQNLEARHLIILEQEDDPTSVCVGPKPIYPFGLGAWRVVADLGAEEGLVTSLGPGVEGPIDVALGQAQVLIHCLHDSDS
ncbi:receptor-like protein kinase-related family protein [Striga asiatica]|uniref:Receptor-like protein kinase-related family protein n=1 Tax=Striga asiatica TaxID=4170 RepID=A0A5A7Q771_STRAF|nr:receptor-like protein kinase-related family protein [Striga asiatica]